MSTSSVDSLKGFLDKLRVQVEQKKNEEAARFTVLKQLIFKLEQNLDLEQQRREETFLNLQKKLETMFEKVNKESIERNKEQFTELKSILDISSERLDRIVYDLKFKDERIKKVRIILEKLQPVFAEISQKLDNSFRQAPLNENSLLANFRAQMKLGEGIFNDSYNTSKAQLNILQQELNTLQGVNAESDVNTAAKMQKGAETIHRLLINEEQVERKANFEKLCSTLNTVSEKLQENLVSIINV